MPRLPDLEAWGVFARLSQTRSFSRTADDLGLATATVSKAITRLEARLGVSLLNRTSRRLALTDVGLIAAVNATRILAEAETMEAGAMEQSVIPAGLVRIAVPMSFGLLYVAKMLPALLAAYPQMTIDLNLNDEFVDVIGANFDLVLRIGAKPDPTLSIQRLCRIRRLLVAAPAYISRFGMPTHPRELAHHKCLLYAPAQRRWRFVGPDAEEYDISPTGPLWATNGNALAPALLDGVGICAQPEFMLAPYLASGQLQHIMPDWSLPLVALHVVTPPGKYQPTNVTITIAFLLELLVKEPWAILAQAEP